MKLATIWTLPAMSVVERLRRTRESLAMSVAARLPVRIKYWVTILAISKVSQMPQFGTKAIGLISADEILQNLEKLKVVA